LIISGVVSSLAIFNGVYPAISQSSDSIRAATTTVSDRIESRIAIIEVGHNASAVNVWIKNIGTAQIGDVSKIDVFFGPSDNFYRVNCGGVTLPYWEYSIEGGKSLWTQATTLHITIHPEAAVTSGNYVIKVVLPNGISDETSFGVE
jgi:archaellum component FlaF (FlaF/FlaG flagellin family)